MLQSQKDVLDAWEKYNNLLGSSYTWVYTVFRLRWQIKQNRYKITCKTLAEQFQNREIAHLYYSSYTNKKTLHAAYSLTVSRKIFYHKAYIVWE